MAPLRQARVLLLRHPLARPVPTTMGPVTCRPALLLRLEDADGAAGWGEIWCNFPPDGDLHRARLAANVLPGSLTGLDTSDPAAAGAVVSRRLHRIALQAGELGPVAQIAAGVDIALNDLSARRAGVKLAVHLGAAARAVPAYASGISPDAFEAQIGRMRSLGYRRFKQRIGFGRDDGLAELDAAAAGLCAGERLMADANQAWDLDTATARLDRLARLDLAWLEEPLPVDAPDPDWLALAAAAPMPLAGGENMRGQATFDAALRLGALDVLQPDACKWGGLTGCLAVARRVLAAGRIYCPHFLGGGIGLLASAHLLAAAGGPGWLEVDSSENPLLALLAGTDLRLVDGVFPLPDGPGLGTEPDLEAARELVALDLSVEIVA